MIRHIPTPDQLTIRSIDSHLRAALEQEATRFDQALHTQRQVDAKLW